MAKRTNIYLDDEAEVLLEQITDSIDEIRRREAGKNFKKYKPIGVSELFKQILIKCSKDNKSEVIDKLNMHCRMKDYYEEQLRALNTGYDYKSTIKDEVSNY